MLEAVDRSAAGHRRYSEHDVSWITLITKLRATGMPIREVKKYADMVRAGAGTEAERLALLKAHRERVERQLTEVTAHLRAIDHKIGYYENHLEAAS